MYMNQVILKKGQALKAAHFFRRTTYRTTSKSQGRTYSTSSSRKNARGESTSGSKVKHHSTGVNWVCSDSTSGSSDLCLSVSVSLRW